MTNLIVDLIALLLIFFLPGLMLTLALFPKKGALDADFDLLLKCVLGILMSLVVSVAVGIGLHEFGSILGSSLIGATELWVSLSLATILFGIIAWYRGGLKAFLEEIRLLKAPKEDGVAEEMTSLAHRKRELQAMISMMESQDYQANDALREEASIRIPLLKKEISDINERIDELVERDWKETDTESDKEKDGG